MPDVGETLHKYNQAAREGFLYGGLTIIGILVSAYFSSQIEWGLLAHWVHSFSVEAIRQFVAQEWMPLGGLMVVGAATLWSLAQLWRCDSVATKAREELVRMLGQQ